jgi:hypothetical protein
MPFSTYLITGCLGGFLGQVLAPCPTPLSIPCQTTVPDRNQQAGYPRTVAWWAIPSDTGAYTVNRVGGGCPIPLLAERPLPHEGTWGWDYVGRWLPQNVLLGWWHGLYQGGNDNYRTDGPTLNHGEGTVRSLHDR